MVHVYAYIRVYMARYITLKYPCRIHVCKSFLHGKVDLSRLVRVAWNAISCYSVVVLIGIIPITGLTTRNNSAICGAILSTISAGVPSVIFTSNSHSRHVPDSMTNVAICCITSFVLSLCCELRKNRGRGNGTPDEIIFSARARRMLTDQRYPVFILRD